jgi:hypothetical protein
MISALRLLKRKSRDIFEQIIFFLLPISRYLNEDLYAKAREKHLFLKLRIDKRLVSRHAFFILHGSFADKWFVLSYLESHLEAYANSIVLCYKDDQRLVELFVRKDLIASRCLFIDREILARVTSVFRPVSPLTTQLADSHYIGGCKHTITPYFWEHGLPTGKVRILHIVYYPYFNELFHLHAVSMGSLVKTILYLHPRTQPRQELYYEDDDYQTAYQLVSVAGASSHKKVLLNAVNFSHSSLSAYQLELIARFFTSRCFNVLINVTQASPEMVLSFCIDCDSVSKVTIPPRALPLVSRSVDAVVGVLGGAMNIAAQFSDTHLLSLQTLSLGSGCPEELLLGKYGQDKIWEMYDQDWACILPGRVISNHFIGNPAHLDDSCLEDILSRFVASITRMDV